MYALLAIAVLTVACWDAHRRAVADKRAAREFERQTSTELSEKLTTLVGYLKQDRKCQADALENFLKQITVMVKFSEERKRELELKLAGKKL